MNEALPFRQFVVKTAARCNLACDYCYVYELRDQGWRNRPRLIADETVTALGRWLRAHAEQAGLRTLDIVLHGGEPLLVGPARLDAIATDLRAALAGVAEPRFTLQTNGVLLDERCAEVLLAHRIRVGVSLDGDEVAHDRHRRGPDGGGSHAATVRGIELLRRPRYRPLYGGLLATIDLANDPVATYEELLAHAPPMIDLLLPHATWEYPPPGARTGETAHADWLIAVFDRWYGAPVRETRVRLLEDLVDLTLGRAVRSETLGLSPAGSVVIETDGTFERQDALKAAYDGAAATGFDVFRHDPATVLAASGFGGLGADAGEPAEPSPTCRRCPVLRTCGGGLRAHRYHPANGFDNPSVYCADLRALIDHVRTRVHADLRALVGPERRR
ncbi:FxsB family cyclophane-forming radical SAM/SPASM peptide maturase [Embleya sp. NPDC005971]|uniref:FxsB family cyclophane-forming radical SAM/SPASM peptide maturase n=1 Tax=unclassified Embleya TaxID=2699296 RepID=UPI0033C70643